jgi:hypothetical protein
MEAHYGTRTITGGAQSTTDLLFLTDHITAGLADAMRNFYPDARVANNVGAWVDNSVSDMEWVLGTPEGLPAADNLLRELTNVGGRCLIVEDSVIGPEIDHGTQTYIMAFWQTNESTPGSVVVGDPDAGGGFTSSGATTSVDHEGYAEVHYFERNSTLVVSPLVLDLDNDGKLLASGGKWLPHPMCSRQETRFAFFDFHGNGFPVETEWVGANDGLLVVPKADGSIDGTCLFGTSTGFDNGYQQLGADRDANGDDRIAGNELNGLMVWADKNGNAAADKGELTSVQDLGITAISLKHNKMVSAFEMKGKTYKMWDWWPSGYELRKRDRSASK